MCVCVFLYFCLSSPSFVASKCLYTFMIDLNPGYFPDWRVTTSEMETIFSQAVKMVRGEMGLKNVEIMIPFVRTLDMAKDVNEVLESWLTKGLKWLVVSSMFYFHPYLGK